MVLKAYEIRIAISSGFKLGVTYDDDALRMDLADLWDKFTNAKDIIE